MSLPYEINLYGPPERLGSRVPLWVISVASFGGTFATWVVIYSLLARTGAYGPSVVALLLLVSIAEYFAIWYVLIRVTGGGVEAGRPAFVGPAAIMSLSVTGEPPRLADREEITAQRRLRRGAITRREYEQIVAYRHFVHNEISREEYHAVLSYLKYGLPPGTGGIPPAEESRAEGSQV